MNLQQVAMTTFVLLQAAWSIENSRKLIEQLQPSHVIVHRHSPKDAFYLLTADESLDLFASTSSARAVCEALDLHEYTPTPARASDTDAESTPDLCVVLENGSPIGFYDVR